MEELYFLCLITDLAAQCHTLKYVDAANMYCVNADPTYTSFQVAITETIDTEQTGPNVMIQEENQISM